MPATSPSLTARFSVVESDRPLNATLMSYRGATSSAMNSTSACSEALPSAVTTVSVAPAVSLGDVESDPRKRQPTTAAITATTTSAPTISGQRRRVEISIPELPGGEGVSPDFDEVPVVEPVSCVMGCLSGVAG